MIRARGRNVAEPLSGTLLAVSGDLCSRLMNQPRFAASSSAASPTPVQLRLGALFGNEEPPGTPMRRAQVKNRTSGCFAGIGLRPTCRNCHDVMDCGRADAQLLWLAGAPTATLFS